MAATYRGFSTVDQAKPSYNLRDIELVKRDLLNHFHTRKGERVMLPNFGSNIQDYIFEPLVDHILEDLRADVRSIIDAEPRVEFIDMHVLESGHLIKIAVELLFKPGDVADTLYLDFVGES